MRNRITLFIVACLLLAVGIPHWLQAQTAAVYPPQLPASAMYEGVVQVKMKPGFAHLLWKKTATGWQTGSANLDKALQKIAASKVDTLFKTVYELADADENALAQQRMEQAGLMRWMTVRFSANLPVMQVCSMFRSLPEVAWADAVGKIELHADPNDAFFANQWYLRNSGQTAGRVGADINVSPAWNFTTGSSDVIVAVHDGGVQLSHPDLQSNMWQGKSFNFVANNTQLTDDNHGTHVAGLLAAVRNNTVGIAGVAGGNGTASTGVKMMSLQIIGGTPVVAGHEALSFVYAANNGAAISQNSWSYNAANFFPQYTADAIDYFMANGGGTVLKGGIVIFSAGNNGTEQTYFPPAYNKVLAVAAATHNDEKAGYSNFGSWVDITAPGGDASQPMLSTITGSNYGNLFGTSMACPLVSGAAALLVSRAPGKMLADDLRSLLQFGVDDIYPINAGNLLGKLGTGRLNVGKSMLRTDSLANNATLAAVTNFSLQPQCSTWQLQWTMPAAASKVLVAIAPADAFIGLPFYQTYTEGQTLPGGGTVVYSGNANSVTIPMPMDGSRWQLRIWASNADGSVYSLGETITATVPVTANMPQAIGSNNSIQLSWQRQCPQRGLLLATSTDGSFGTPTGDPAAVTIIPGGGQRLQQGNQTGFVHTGLQADQTYYYALYPYQFNGTSWEYGEPVTFAGNTACAVKALPIEESFTSTTYPPVGWRLQDGGPNGSLVADGKTWRRLQLAGSSAGDDISVLMNAYTQNGNNSKETLRTAAFTMPDASVADSVIVLFDYAYRAYAPDADLADSLEVAYSLDCGTTYQTLWKAGGAGLASVPGFSTAEFVPFNLSDWASKQLKLPANIPAGATVSIGFIGTNKFGQNLWLDNIRVRMVERNKADLSLPRLTATTDTVLCNTIFTPRILLRNNGAAMLQSAQIVLLQNGQRIDSAQYAALALAANKDTSLPFKPVNLNLGVQQLHFVVQPLGGIQDPFAINDTLRVWVSVAGNASLPYQTSMEDNASVPVGWTSTPVNQGWMSSNAAAASGSKALLAKRFGQTSTNTYEWRSPVMAPISNADSLLLYFTKAAAPTSAIDATAGDTLDILWSNDCGLNWQTVASRFGSRWHTAPATDVDYVPQLAHWQKDTIDLTALLPSAGTPFQLAFRLKAGGSNNGWLDDLRLLTKNVPASLKSAGFGVYPNPFSGQFLIWHYQPEPRWRSARLLSATGQVLQQWQWTANPPQTLQVSTAHLPAGLYYVQLQYDGFSRTEKLLKY